MKNILHKKWFLIIIGLFVVACVIVLSRGRLFSTHQTNAIYIYMCGSNLETDGAAATANLKEMLGAQVSDETTVVIETGGSRKWRDYQIDSHKLSRYVIEDNELVLKETVDNRSMGESDTLSDFLAYCKREYPADRKAVILWDHGGGSLGGVCYDENYQMDSLSLSELTNAFAGTGEHYDLIGFDACLMASLDTAVAMSPYGDYMLASEEIEPSGGWDYVSVLENFSSNQEIETIGKKICDAYLKKCENNEKAFIVTLSLLDLSKTEDTLKHVGSFAKKLKKRATEKYGNFTILSAVDKSAKFGGNSEIEGYSNLIDLYSFSEKFEETDNSDLCKSIKQLVVYCVDGGKRKNAMGISLYYPSVYKKKQLDQYLSLCPVEEYKEYLKGIYEDVPKKSIHFKDKGSVAKDGSFQMSLSSASKKYVKAVDFYLIEFEDNNQETEEPKINGLGVDNDIYKNWEKMKFHSNFRGVWLGLDGNLLSYSVVESSEERIVFSAPVIINDSTVTNLRFAYIWDDKKEEGGYYTILGLWDGIDEDGIASKEITQLQKGDKVTILSRRLNSSDYLASLSKGKTITIGDEGGVISEIPLRNKNYQYVYAVTDIFGNVYYSSTALFEMKYSYDELLKNPLPDGKYAAEVTVISEDVDNQTTYGGVRE